MDYDEGGTEVIEFCTIDRRIGQTFTDNVHDPELARYLERAVREHGGTLMVARLIVGALAPYFEKRKGSVGPEDIERLSVHDLGDDVIEKVSLALKDFEPTYILRVHDLLTSLGYQLVEPVDGLPVEACKRMEIRLVPRVGVIQDPQIHEIYARIFICALAMWCGVKINPRELNHETRAAAGG